jgi:hypothetical protein
MFCSGVKRCSEEISSWVCIEHLPSPPANPPRTIFGCDRAW